MDEKPGCTAPQIPPAREQSPWALAGLGIQFFVAILLFVVIGNWLDTRAGTAPLFLLSGLFFGGGGTFYVSYRRLMASSRLTNTSAPSCESASDVEPSA